MARGRPPLFLQPEPYRKRRLIDAARLLPVFGLFLFVVPMLLLPKGVAGTTADALIYLFLLWSLLIVFSGLITRYIKRAERARGPGASRGRDADAGDGD
jgi:hypothetical protein